MSNLQPNYMKNQMQAVAAQAAIGQESVCRTVTFAITGDAVSDCMAGLRKVCDESGLSARQIQFIFQCYVALYKDAADLHDKDQADRELRNQKIRAVDWSGTQPMPFLGGSPSVPAPTYTARYAEPWDESNPEFVKFRARIIAEMTSNAQSGTHSPSTMRPDSRGGS